MRKVIVAALLLIASTVLGQTEGKSPFVKLGSPKADSTWNIITVDTLTASKLITDTLIINRVIHNQEVALFDSTLEIVGDGDTLRFDASINGNVIEYEDENVTVWNVDSTGTQTISKPGIGTLPTTAATINAIGLVLQNTTAAANGAQQDSPPLRFRGYGWGTTAGTSQFLDWVIYNKISQGVTPTTTLSFLYSANGGAYTQLATLTETGIFSTNYLTASVNVRVLMASITTTPTDGLVATQDALCTAAMPYRISPRLRFGACVWDSSGTPASKAQNFTNEVIPVSGGTVLPAPSASTARLRWSFDHNGGGYSEIMSLRGDGNLGLGTTNPLFDLSIVNSNPAANNGIHIVDSNVNKNRTTYAQATDSASAMLSTIGGDGTLRLKAPDGDSLNVTAGSVVSSISSKNSLSFIVGGNAYLMSSSTTTGFAPNVTDSYSLGNLSSLWQRVCVTDNGYIGGKGQTAKLTIGTMNTMTEETDSCVVVDGAASKITVKDLFTPASSTNDHLQFKTAPDSLLVLNGSHTGRDSSMYVLPSGKLVTTGDMSYALRHAFGAFSDSSITIDVTANVYSKITNPYNTLFTVVEASNITFAGDSLTIVTAGDYLIQGNIQVTAANGDIIKVGVFKNSILQNSKGFKFAAASDTKTLPFMWYFEDLSAGDDICLKVTNTADSDDPTITDGTLYFEKKHD